MNPLEGYIVNSNKLAKRILEVQPSSFVVVVSSLSNSSDWVVKKKIGIALEQCNRVRILMPFNLINEEIVNSLKRSHNLCRILVPNSMLRDFKRECRGDYASLTDSELESILNLE